MQMDPELSARLKELGFRPGDIITAPLINERLAAAAEEGRRVGWAEAVAALRDEAAPVLAKCDEAATSFDALQRLSATAELSVRLVRAAGHHIADMIERVADQAPKEDSGRG